MDSALELSKVILVGDHSQIIIPHEFLRALEFQAGDEVIVRREGLSLRMTTRKTLIDKLFGVYAVDDGCDLTSELLEERKHEASQKWS